MYAGDEYYDDDVTSGPLPEEELDLDEDLEDWERGLLAGGSGETPLSESDVQSLIDLEDGD